MKCIQTLLLGAFITVFLSAETPLASTEIKIDVNGTTLTAELTDNSSADAFAEMLKKAPLTVDMSDYGDFEKVGSLGTTLPRNDQYITTSPGDIILYQGNSITIYYDVNSWNFTKLGKIKDISQAELKSILGEGDVSATFYIPEEKEEAFLYGDATADNILAANDAASVLQKVLSGSYKMPIENMTENYFKYIDVDANGRISSSDAAFILQKVLIGSFMFPAVTS